MSGPDSASELLGSLAMGLAPLDGKCEAHGAASVLVRAGQPWYCPACLEAKKRDEYAQQWAKDRTDTLHAIAGIPSKYKGQRFQVSKPEHKAVRAMAAHFRDFVIAKPTWAALILTGTMGTGKTQLACEFAESWINRLCRSVRYVTAKGMISEIQASYGREGKSEEGEIERFVQYDMLILDEVDAIPSKDNAALLLNEVINRRYSNDKPIIVISNQSLGDLGRYVGDRVLDRLHENSFICLFDWPSFRRAA